MGETHRSPTGKRVVPGLGCRSNSRCRHAGGISDGGAQRVEIIAARMATMISMQRYALNAA